MNYTRYIIDLQGNGRFFKMFLLNLGVPTQYIETAVVPQTYLDMTYNECASQILMAFDSDDIRLFYQKLMNLPDMKFFQNISVLHDPVKYDMFCKQFREFGVFLAFQIQEKIGLNLNAEYLLESIAEDFIVIGVSLKEQR